MPSVITGQNIPQLPALRSDGLTELRQLLHDDDRIVRVHAAESLIRLGESAGIHEQFMLEWNRCQQEPGYRAVVMRVLCQSSADSVEREQWKSRLRDLFRDESQPDRLHAIECLAKLGGAIPDSEQATFAAAANHEQPEIAIFSHWAMAAAGQLGHEESLIAYLKNSDPTARYCAAYALRHQPQLADKTRATLKAAARHEATGTLAYAYLNSASLVASASTDPEEANRARNALLRIANCGSKDELREMCGGLAICGTESDLPILTEFLQHTDPDVRAGAADAILQIICRAA